MTIRSQIGSAEVTLEGTEVRTAMTADLLLRYDTDALLFAVGEVLRGIGDGHLSEDARQILAIIEGEPGLSEADDQDVLQALSTVDSQYEGAHWPTVAGILAYEVRRLRGLPVPPPAAEERSAEEEDEDNLPWSPPVAGATGSPLL